MSPQSPVARRSRRAVQRQADQALVEAADRAVHDALALAGITWADRCRQCPDPLIIKQTATIAADDWAAGMACIHGPDVPPDQAGVPWWMNGDLRTQVSSIIGQRPVRQHATQAYAALLRRAAIGDHRVAGDRTPISASRWGKDVIWLARMAEQDGSIDLHALFDGISATPYVQRLAADMALGNAWHAPQLLVDLLGGLRMRKEDADPTTDRFAESWAMSVLHGTPMADSHGPGHPAWVPWVHDTLNHGEHGNFTAALTACATGTAPWPLPLSDLGMSGSGGVGSITLWPASAIDSTIDHAPWLLRRCNGINSDLGRLTSAVAGKPQRLAQVLVHTAAERSLEPMLDTVADADLLQLRPAVDAACHAALDAGQLPYGQAWSLCSSAERAALVRRSAQLLSRPACLDHAPRLAVQAVIMRLAAMETTPSDAIQACILRHGHDLRAWRGEIKPSGDKVLLMPGWLVHERGEMSAARLRKTTYDPGFCAAMIAIGTMDQEVSHDDASLASAYSGLVADGLLCCVAEDGPRSDAALGLLASRAARGSEPDAHALAQALRLRCLLYTSPSPRDH
jgi:hypothetical protein